MFPPKAAISIGAVVVKVYTTSNACVAGLNVGLPLTNSALFPPEVPVAEIPFADHQPCDELLIFHPKVAPVWPLLSIVHVAGSEKLSCHKVDIVFSVIAAEVFSDFESFEIN